MIEYDTGECVFAQLRGIGDEIDLHFEKSMIKFPATFIALSTRKTVRIYNKSNVKVPV